MKIQPDHYQRLCDAVQQVADANDLDAYRSQLADDPRVKDIDKRLRWDILYAIPADIRHDLMDDLYSYCNDAHIDTALRRAMSNLGAAQ